MSKTLAELRAENTPVEDELPCGLAIQRKRSVSMEEMLISGFIPAPLLGAFQEAREKTETDAEAGQRLIVSEESADVMRMINAVFKEAVVLPKVVDAVEQITDPAGQIALNDPFLRIEDKMYVFAAVTEGQMKFKSFRNGHEQPAQD